MSTSTKVPPPRGTRKDDGWHPLDIVPGKHKPKLQRNGAIFVILTAIFLFVIYTKPPLPFSGSGRTLKADFSYAADISPGRTPVRVRGVDVGTVTGQRFLPGNKGVQLTMSLSGDPSLKVTQDASAQLRWRTLLGLNYYVDLSPGSPSAPPLSGGVIPASHTGSQVELDQVLEPLNATGRQGVTDIIDGFDAGFGAPGSVRTTIHTLAPSMQSLAQGLPPVRGTDPGVDLPGIITHTNVWATRLAADEANLADLVGNADGALAVTAAEHVPLGDTFAQAPAALQQTQLTMQRLQSTLSILDPIAQRLRPGARTLYSAAVSARAAVTAARPLLVDLKPTLAAVRPSVASLGTAARAGVPVIASLTSTLDRTRNTFIPWLNQYELEPGSTTLRGTGLKNFQDVGPTVAAASALLGYGDQFGTLAGFEGGSGRNLFSSTSPCMTFVDNPSRQQILACAALTQLIQNIYSGQPITEPLRGLSVNESQVLKLLGVKK